MLCFSSTWGGLRAEDYTPTTLSAVEVLHRAATASGKLEPGKYVIVEHTTGGGLDATTTTSIDGEDWTAVEQRGPFTTSAGSIGGQRWAQDENGIVRLESAFHEKVNPNVAAWQHPEDPRYNVRVLGLTGTPQEYALEANPPGGSDQYRYYDAQTFLLDRSVTFSKDRYRHVTVYSDYRKVFGRTRAFSERSSDGRPQNDEASTTTSFERAAGDAPSMQIPRTRPLFAMLGDSLRLPASFTPRGIVVHAKLGNRGCDFLLDSGASGLTLDPGVAHELGLAAYGRQTVTIGGDLDVSQTIVPALSVGALDMHDVAFKLVAMNIQIDDQRIVGLLGYDLLASGIFGIDFKNRTLTLYSPEAFRSESAGMLPIPAQLDDEVPRVPVKVGGVDGSFLFDTGAFATLVYKHYLAKLPDARNEDVGEGSIAVVGGSVATKVYQIPAMIFGPVRFAPSDVVVPQTSTFDTVDYDGILGRNFLATFAAYLDYADRTIYIDPQP